VAPRGIVRIALGALAILAVLALARPAVGGFFPVNTVTAVEPSTVESGDAHAVVTLRGTFIKEDVGNAGGDDFFRVFFDDVSVRADVVEEAGTTATALSASVPASVAANPPGHTIAVSVSRCGLDDGELTCNPPGNATIPVVQSFPPLLISITPTTAIAGSSPVTLTLAGRFSHRSVVRVDGSDRPTTFVSATRIQAVLPASDLATPGSRTVTVVTPPPGGGTTTAFTFTVNSAGPAGQPTIAAIVPAEAAPGDLVAIVGSGFGTAQGTGRVTFGGRSAGEAPLWRDERIETFVPGLPPGPANVQVLLPSGTALKTQLQVTSQAAEPPIANAVAIPVTGRSLVLDASLSVDPESLGQPASTAAFSENALGPGIADVLWRFGDGTSSHQPTVTKTYSRPGTYNVSLTVRDSSGRSSTPTTQTVRVTRTAVALPPVNISIPSRIVFDVGSATTRPESASYLRQLADLVRRIGRPTEVQGHTDSTGPAAYNQQLSEQRARAVVAVLVDDGVAKELLTALGFGESMPIASNDTALGRQMNRRVVLHIARAGDALRLTPGQVLINQRISQAAIRRERALRAALAAGLTGRDIQNGSFGRNVFAPGIQVAGNETGASVAPGPRRAIAVPNATGGGNPGAVKLSAGQLLINQRVSQAAVRRVNALATRLDAGLTGADVRDGSIGPAELVPGLAIVATAAGPPAPPSVRPAPTAPLGDSGSVELSIEQLKTNQRISQAAVRRLNAIRERLEEGLTGADFRDGSITVADLAPDLR
jgi:outer membrane protein OmpA-like peptidoglycan-associated protein